MSSVKKRMKKSWNDKAKENAYHWVDSSKDEWGKNNYYKKGEKEAYSLFIKHLDEQGISIEQMKKMCALDIGCGTGRLMRGLSKYFLKIDGIDISQEMIEIAKKDNAEINNLTFEKGDGINIGVGEKRVYDFIYSYIVFQHIPSKTVIENYFKQIYKLLKENGFLKVQVRGHPGKLDLRIPSFLFKGFDSFYFGVDRRKFILYPVIRRYDTLYGAFYKKKELKNMVSKIGFKDICVELDPTNKKYLWVTARKVI